MNQQAMNGEAGRGLGAAPGSATGWWNPTPYSARRRAIFHYVADDGRTLCRKWAYVGLGTVEEGEDAHSDNCSYVGLGTVEEGEDAHSDNCAECKKKKLALCK